MSQRLRGYPTSSNRASSFHLHWNPGGALQEVWVTLQIAQPPQVPELYFWALQASFTGPGGVTGGAHLGLQWHPRYPGNTAVNWGGYDRQGDVLSGTSSTLPSALANDNTRDYPWEEGVSYRLRIYSERPGWWTGEITDPRSGDATAVRSLAGGGDHLTLAMVWSEVFARCDAPPVAVVWSDPGGLTVDGQLFRPGFYTTSYQSVAAGGCSNTDIRPLPSGVGQFTAVTRNNPAGGRLPAH